MSILKFEHYNHAVDLRHQFKQYFNNEILLESEGTKKVLKSVVNDLRLNTAVIFSFGTGMELLIPIVKKLCENGEFKIDLNIQTVTLMTLTAVTIAYLEEVKEEKLRKELEKDSKSLLEEMKLRGVGNGIIKKIVRCIKSIGSLAKLVTKHKKSIITSFFEMLGYAALCVPVLNSVNALVGKYDMTLDSFSKNIASLILGLGSLSVKNIFNWLMDKGTMNQNADEYVDSRYDSDDDEDKLIKEQ